MMRTTIAILAIVTLFCWLSNDDYQAEQVDSAYTAEIMEHAKQEALAKEEYNRLRDWGEQFDPVAMGGGNE